MAMRSPPDPATPLRRSSTRTDLTLFAFARGQGLSEHTAPFDACVQIIEGAAQITVGGEEHRVEEGRMLIMPANVPHALQAQEPFKMLLTMIKKAA